MKASSAHNTRLVDGASASGYINIHRSDQERNGKCAFLLTVIFGMTVLNRIRQRRGRIFIRKLTSDKNDGRFRRGNRRFYFPLPVVPPSVLWHKRHPRRKTRVFMGTDRHLSSARRLLSVHTWAPEFCQCWMTLPQCFKGLGCQEITDNARKPLPHNAGCRDPTCKFKFVATAAVG